VLKCWVTYRQFWFDPETTAIHTADAKKVTDIAAYLKRNPSLEVGIDSSMDAKSNNNRHNLDLAKRRGTAVHDALVAAGLPASRIKSGELGDAKLRRNGRVVVLLKTASPVTVTKAE
jgi:outer membrane protein OmpA-like peptidoglycan-associated protein